MRVPSKRVSNDRARTADAAHRYPTAKPSVVMRFFKRLKV
jgi:hypothetical protein